LELFFPHIDNHIDPVSGAGIEAFLLTQAAIVFLAFSPKTFLPDRSYAPWRWRFKN